MSIPPKVVYIFVAIPTNINGIIHINRRNNHEIHLEPQKTLNIQRNLEKEGQNWRHCAPWFQTVLQSYSKQNNVVLSSKQKNN